MAVQEKPLVERFWKYVAREPDSGCWLWTGACRETGYGVLREKVDGRWKCARSHRIAYELFVGKIPDGMLVCHKCDVPRCVNPDHLFIGTHKDNMRDHLNKGKHHYAKRDECKYGHKFTPQNTRIEIRKTGSRVRRCLKCKELRNHGITPTRKRTKQLCN